MAHHGTIKSRKNDKLEKTIRRIDLTTTLIPFVTILGFCGLFIVVPEESTNALSSIREFLGDELGIYYLIIGLGVLVTSAWIAFSDIGKIRLGKKDEKPQYSFWTWGAMVFTCGLAADILFYSFCEWIFYSQESRVAGLGSIQEWASTYPLFHWGPIPWSFYATLAACFGFMLHVRGVKKQKYSEACRPLLGGATDKIPGKIIDMMAVFALIAGTATTFSVATPLLSAALRHLLGVEDSKYLKIGILVATCLVYTFAVMKGVKGVSWLANVCMWLFGILLCYVLFLGGEAKYIVEMGFTDIGNMFQNFIGLATWTDAMRTSFFPQNWTIFYWAYWMVWCVASPFFMGNISRGRTVKQVIIGAYVFGVSSTWISFIVLGNYGLAKQVMGELDSIALFGACGDIYHTIIAIIDTMPMPGVALALLGMTGMPSVCGESPRGA